MQCDIKAVYVDGIAEDGQTVRRMVEARDYVGVSDEELSTIVHNFFHKENGNLLAIILRPVDTAPDEIDVETVPIRQTNFERIRRITGYLVGDTSRWNNAKRAELKDRTKHGMEG